MFNGDISRGAVADVVHNGDMPKWSVPSVTRMDDVFSPANMLNGDISEVAHLVWTAWTACFLKRHLLMATHRSGTPVSVMFSQAPSFNGGISKWDASSAMYHVRLVRAPCSLERYLMATSRSGMHQVRHV